MDVVATLEMQASALREAEMRLLRFGDREGAERMQAAQEPLEFAARGKEPAMLLITGRARCSCDNAEVVTESVTIRYDTPDDEAGWIMKRLLRNLRAEVSAHILQQGHKKDAA